MSHDQERPLRLFCPFCLEVTWHPVKAVVRMPTCCGRELWIAGEAKVDRYGVRSIGCQIDPVAEYLSVHRAEKPNPPRRARQGRTRQWLSIGSTM